MVTDRDILDAPILIVDDEPPNVLLLRRILEREGYTSIHETTDSRQAAALYREIEPALVLLDLRMPHLDGFAVMKQLQEIEGGRYAPILVLTAIQDERTRLRALAAGAKDFLTKPFNREEVLSRIRNLLEVRLLYEQVASDQQRLRAVLDATQDAIAMIDPSGRFRFVNRHFREWLRLPDIPTSEHVCEAIRAILPDEAPFEAFRRCVFDDPEDTSEDILRTTLPNRPALYYYTSPVYDLEGNLIGRILVFRDLSKELEIDRMKEEILELRAALERDYAFDNIVGDSPPMRELYAAMRQVLDSDITVLIQGESGTGKELVAKALHFNGPRRKKPFIAVNCAAIPESLIESELFGHERGAFTGANTRRIGKFERANGGTLFLDEIGEMPLALQPKLLRVLQEREIERIGGDTPIPVDVRIIAATNRDLEQEMREGRFREDLYYRIAAFPIRVPPLRERREDIPLLAEYFLQRTAQEEKKEVLRVSEEALERLLAYDWPGNVRELENVIQRAVLVERSPILQVSSLPSHLQARPRRRLLSSSRGEEKGFLTLEEAEKEALLRALEAHDYQIQRTAEALGINRATLYRKMKRHGLEVPKE